MKKPKSTKDLPYQTVDSTATVSTIDFDNAALATWKAQFFHTTMGIAIQVVGLFVSEIRKINSPVEVKVVYPHDLQGF